MFPDPHDALPLPGRPDVENYRKRAKDLAKASKGGDVRDWAQRWMAGLGQGSAEVDRIAAFARERLKPPRRALAEAQFVIARVHGFSSWPKFVAHLEALAEPSPTAAFERAADAIADGDLATLRRLLRKEPRLVRARSTREHRATLLHYVSANGVENYRQKTPANIVELAAALLDAGAEVDAEADLYGGGATPLGLVVTSAHPRRAGVQDELADLLIARGARVQPGIVRSCLLNGCPEAAAHLASRGLQLDLDEAAGLGRVDLADGRFDPAAAAQAMIMAAWYDRRAVVERLLERGVDPDVRDPRDGKTALDVARHLGNAPLADLLRSRGAKD